ncbi:UVR8 [Symbiodinium sp. CCMP2592]|nr:UVR8 [Symbiodinium sp. CCMP2592]
MAAVKMLALLSAVCILTAVAEEVAKLSLGDWHVCAMGSQGSVKCWGNNGNAQLGQGDDVRRGDGANEMGKSLPTIDLGTGRHALEVNSGASHNCARLDDGLLKCWGYGHLGRLGYGDQVQRGGNSDEMGDFLPTVELGTGRTAVQLALGYEFSCAVLDNASVKCWGQGGYGQLGIGTTSNMGAGSSEMGDHLPPVDLGTGRTAADVTAGSYFACARLDDSSLKCWGHGEYGQLGIGSNSYTVGRVSGEMGDNLPTVDLGTGRTAVELSAGVFHACARLDNGSVKCWGRNNNNQLGLGFATSINMGDDANEMGNYLPPVDLGTGRTAAELSSGKYHTCARLDDGTIRCWGKNEYGELGHAGTLPSNVDLGTGRTAVHVAAGGYVTCALLDNQETKCWGGNTLGMLGLGDTQDRGKSSSDMGSATSSTAATDEAREALQQLD